MPFLLYIDPGTGSYLAQVVIAAMLGVLYYFKAVRDFLSHIFRKLTGNKKPS